MKMQTQDYLFRVENILMGTTREAISQSCRYTYHRPDQDYVRSLTPSAHSNAAVSITGKVVQG